MDLVQLTTHIDATAVRHAADTQAAFVTRESRDAIDREVRASLSETVAVILFDGNDHEVHHLAPGASLRVGRSITADILLEDPMISRKHAVIDRHDGQLRVLDDRSLNGVFVNGDRIDEQRPLEDADEVHLGGFVLRIVIAA